MVRHVNSTKLYTAKYYYLLGCRLCFHTWHYRSLIGTDVELELFKTIVLDKRHGKRPRVSWA